MIQNSIILFLAIIYIAGNHQMPLTVIPGPSHHTRSTRHTVRNHRVCLFSPFPHILSHKKSRTIQGGSHNDSTTPSTNYLKQNPVSPLLPYPAWSPLRGSLAPPSNSDIENPSNFPSKLKNSLPLISSRYPNPDPSPYNSLSKTTSAHLVKGGVYIPSRKFDDSKTRKIEIIYKHKARSTPVHA